MLYLLTMKSNEIKSILKKNFGLTSVSVRAIPGVGRQWIHARIVPNPPARVLDALIYTATFPEVLRRACISAVYGDEMAQKQSAAGNIGAYSISLYADQWANVLASFDEALADLGPDVAAGHLTEVEAVAQVFGKFS